LVGFLKAIIYNSYSWKIRLVEGEVRIGKVAGGFEILDFV